MGLPGQEEEDGGGEGGGKKPSFWIGESMETQCRELEILCLGVRSARIHHRRIYNLEYLTKLGC